MVDVDTMDIKTTITVKEPTAWKTIVKLDNMITIRDLKFWGKKLLRSSMQYSAPLSISKIEIFRALFREIDA